VEESYVTSPVSNINFVDFSIQSDDNFGVTSKVNDTFIYNTFVLCCQLFNELNARKLENKNVFEAFNEENSKMRPVELEYQVSNDHEIARLELEDWRNDSYDMSSW